MPNMKNIINMHNKKIIHPPTKNVTKTCNCIKKNQCPLNEKCLTESLVYKADIISNEENSKTKVYYGLSETTFKVRYANHKKTFNYLKYKSDSELSHEFWNIKNSNNNPIFQKTQILRLEYEKMHAVP